MLWIVSFYQSYGEYFTFVFSAIIVSLFYYFFVSTFLEMNMDLMKKTLLGHQFLLAAIFASINTVPYVFLIYYFGVIFEYRGANHWGLLFLLLAWAMSTVVINKRFNVLPWFSFLLFNVTWLGLLLLWLQR